MLIRQEVKGDSRTDRYGLTSIVWRVSVWVSEIRKEVKIEMEMDKGIKRGERGKVVVAVVVVVVVVIVMMVEIVIVIVMTRE